MTPQFLEGTNPRHTLRRFAWACLIISVQVDHAHEMRGEKLREKFPLRDADGNHIPNDGFPEDHDRWEHEVFWPKKCNPGDKQEYDFVGRFTNYGQAIDAARKRFEVEK